MAQIYTKNTWSPGDVITVGKIQHIEDGVLNVSEETNNLISTMPQNMCYITIDNKNSEIYILNNIEWVQGKYSPSSGEEESASRIRTSWFPNESGLIIYNPNSERKFAIYKLKSDNTSSLYDSTTWYSNEYLYIPPNEDIISLRLMERLTGDGGAITPEDNKILIIKNSNLITNINKVENEQKINAIRINNRFCNSKIPFEQGRFTTTVDEDSSYIIRTNWFSNEVYIHNPQRLSFSVLQNDGSNNYQYLTFSNAVPNISNFYNDTFAHLPALKVGSYRIMVRDYKEETNYHITPDSSTLSLLIPEHDNFEYFLGAVTTSGFSFNKTNLLAIGEIGNHYGINFKIKNSNYRYAIYAQSGSTISAVTSGYSTGTNFVSDKSLTYIIRVSPKSGVTFNYEDAIAALQIEYIDEVYGYERSYTDITHSLQWSHQTIDDNLSIVSSDYAILAELPNAGNIEVKMNRPNIKFRIYEQHAGIMQMQQDWSNYYYRYTADNSGHLHYYLVVAMENGGDTISDAFTAGRRGIKVYTYEDVGKKYDYCSIYGKTVAVLGDSIVQGRFTKNNGDFVNAVMTKPWPNLIAERLNVEPADYGIGGAQVYGYDWLSLYSNRDVITGYEIVFVCGGTNDFGAGVAISDFKSAYSAILTDLINNNTRVIAVTPTCRTSNNTNSLGLRLLDYADAIKEVANNLNVEVIDLYTITRSNPVFVNSIKDGIHPNEVGQKMIADFILESL